MATRGTTLYERIQRIVGIKDTVITDVIIFDTLNDIQKQIAQRLFCVEKSGTLTTNSSGVASEPSGFLRLKRLVTATNTQVFPKEVDVTEYDVLQHTLFTNVGTTILYYKRWAGSFTFFPNPDVTTYTIYYYGLPTTSITTAVEPEIPSYMDDALRLGTIAEALTYRDTPEALAKAKYFKDLYDEEMKRIEGVWRGTKTISNQIYYQD